MIMYNRNVLIVIIALIFSCNGKEIENDSKSQKTYLSHKIDELTIDLNDSLMNDYPYSSRMVSAEGELFYIGFNPPYHKLDIFNLDKMTFEFDIQLETDGPNGVMDPWDFYVVNFDSIYFLGKDSRLSLINRQGEISQDYNLNQMGAKGRESNTMGFKANPIMAKLHFDSDNNQIFFGAYSWKYSPTDLKYYDEPFLSFLDLNTNEIELINLEYPEIYKAENKNFGEAFDPNIVVLKDRIIYSFPIISDLFVYDRKTKESKHYPVSSDMSTRDLFTLSKEEYRDIKNRLIARVENPYFYQVKVDEKNELYYRIYTSGIQYDSNDENFESLADKPVSIQILDADFKLIKEIQLDQNIYNALSSFITPNGDLLVPKSNSLNQGLREDQLAFERFVFKFE